MNKLLILNEIREYYKFKSDADFARFLGINSQNIRNWYKRNNYNSNLLIEKCKEINPQYIITGKGNLLVDKSNVLKDSETPCGIPYYNVDFIAGFENVLNDQTINYNSVISFPNIKGAECWVDVSGKSMEPLISPGDVIALRKVNDWKNNILYGEVYAIITEEYRTIKRIRKSSDENSITLVPENQEYDKQDINISCIRSV